MGVVVAQYDPSLRFCNLPMFEQHDPDFCELQGATALNSEGRSQSFCQKLVAERSKSTFKDCADLPRLLSPSNPLFGGQRTRCLQLQVGSFRSPPRLLVSNIALALNSR